ncbi:hypothetical protein J9K56_004077 [Salmonella enterica]|nr:hypothetical protein [Salmonella enterica subsp. enterica]EHI1891869.1 hypothetical protein [Salmonella enterica]EHJ3070341.1 hypothetical protein [Salmonella enterica]
MTTITNKKQYPSEQYLNELITNMEFAAMAPVEVVRVMAAELQERRKADNQEPAGYHVIRECGKIGCSVATLEEAEKTRDFWSKKWTIRPYFYSAAPASVVPEEHYQHLSELYHAQEKRLFKIAQRIKGPAFDKYSHSPSQAIDVLESAIFGENEATCRATMLQAEPVTTANKLGNSQVHSDCCQEQSPIDHGYRPECECSGCKATARICAELTGNSPVIPEGLVKAVHFYEQAKRENPPIETGVWKDAIDWVLKEACLAASTLESSREHEVISQQEKA